MASTVHLHVYLQSVSVWYWCNLHVPCDYLSPPSMDVCVFNTCVGLSVCIFVCECVCVRAHCG